MVSIFDFTPSPPRFDRRPSPPRFDRTPSPPPIQDPLQDEDDDDSWAWYYGDPGGGTRLHFGKFRGQRLNQTGWSYLQWCRQKLTDSVFIDSLHSTNRPDWMLIRGDLSRLSISIKRVWRF